MTIFVFLPALFAMMILALFWVPATARVRQGRKKAAAIMFIAPFVLFGLIAVGNPEFAFTAAAILLLPFTMIFGPPLLAS